MDGQPGSTFPRDELADLLAVPGQWTTLYVDGPDGSPGPERAARRTAIRDRLARAGTPERHIGAALDALIDEGPPSPSTQTVLVRDGSVVLNELHSGPRLGAEVVAHGPVPWVVPLLRERERDVGFLIVEVGRDGGELRMARGHPQDVVDSVEVEGRTDFLTKVRTGGASQARYHRASEEVWRENADEVGKAVDRAVREHDPAFIVVAGDVRARELLLEDLAPESLDRVVEVSAHTRAPGASSKELDDEIAARLAEQLDRERQDVATRSAENDGRYGERGLGPVVHALQQAQVEALLLDPRDDDRTVLALDAPPWIATDPADSLAAGVLDEVPALEGLARAAVLTDARVYFVDTEPEDADAPRPDEEPAEPVAWMRWETGPDRP
jgi:hypothetical protein